LPWLLAFTYSKPGSPQRRH